MTHGQIRRVRRGVVASFDEQAGLGSISEGDEEWFFHCSAISDGSRKISVGVEVVFAITPGHMGRLEAREIRPA